jgi:hypothetical protein
LSSCTSVPHLYGGINNLNFYDLPGYLDTKGIRQQIINAYSTSQMFRLGIRAKFVLVVEVSSLQSAKAGGLVDVTHRFIELFRPNFEEVVGSCILLITKVPGILYSKEQIIETLEDIFQNN